MNDEFFRRRASRLIRATAVARGISYPADGLDRVKLVEAIKRDDTFVSESHPQFTNGAVLVETHREFGHYYARIEERERASIVRDALALLEPQ